VLVWILIVVAALWALRRVFFAYPRPRDRYQVIAAREAAFLDAVSETTFPAGGSIPISGRDADTTARIDGMLTALPARQRGLIRALFLLLEQATLFFPAPGAGGFRRFSALRAEQRAAVLSGWLESRLFVRQLAFAALRALLTMAYLEHPAVARHLGLAHYDLESPICEADRLYPPIGKRPEENPLRAAELTPPSTGVPIDLDGPLHAHYRDPIHRDPNHRDPNHRDPNYRGQQEVQGRTDEAGEPGERF
jgi:hypothetical protein